MGTPVKVLPGQALHRRGRDPGTEPSQELCDEFQCEGEGP